MVFPLPVGLPLSVYENVAYAPRRAGIHDRRELDAIVEKCLRQAMLWDEVKDRLNMLGTKLSGGQQQRLTLARALSLRPEILCLDEFSIAIDPVTTMRIEDILRELKNEMTIVLVTNLVQQARRLADRTAFFSDSRLIEVGETETIFTKAANRLPSGTYGRRRMIDAATARTRPPTYSIQTRGLNLWYGDFQALKDVEVNIKPGIITALIGPSGCGKTTLLRCFNRINERYGNVTTTGEVTVLGKNIYDADVSLSALRKSVGMVFQRPNPLPISIYENVLFGVRVHTPRGAFTPPAARRDGRVGAARGAALGRGQGPAAPPGDAPDAGTAAEAVHRPAAAAEAAGDPDGRALLGARRRGDRAHRGLDRRPAGEVHDRDRHAQHGPGPARQPRVHLHADGPNHRARLDTLDMFLKPKHPDTEMYVRGRYG